MEEIKIDMKYINGTYGIKRRKNNQVLGIVDKEQTIIIRAICCIVVILVHIPKTHGNIIQNAIGSFGYIAVTLFFMFSAYGLKYSVDNKKNYLHGFWKNRILVLLIPFWIANIINVCCYNNSNTILNNILIILGIKNISFITILISYYIIFWTMYKLIKNKNVADLIICLIVFLYSALGKILNFSTGWMVESIGFIYGILIYYYSTNLKNLRKLNQFIMFAISSIILVILYLKYKEIYMLGTWMLRTLLALNLILLLIIILNNFEIKSKILSYIGNISYEVYLMHGIVVHLMLNVTIPSTLWIILCIILTILISTVIKFVDTKIINLIKNSRKV